MPRQAKLRKKKIGKATYWFTEAGDETYFGKRGCRAVLRVPKPLQRPYQEFIGGNERQQDTTKDGRAVEEQLS